MLATVAVTLTALLAIGYATVCAAIAHRFTTAQRRAPVAPAAGTATVHFLSRDGRARIAAWYDRPAGCHAAVVFVHGRGTCRGDELKCNGAVLAGALVAAGIAVLRIDLRGHGTSSAGRLTYGQNERHDVLGAVDWLKAQGHDRIGLLGASMGAASALLAATEEPAVAALVADGHAIAAACGARLWTTDASGHIGTYRAQPARCTALVLAFFGQHLGGAMGVDLSDDPGEALGDDLGRDFGHTLPACQVH
jgi:pimeloyl-ACP methyl ester carboxylesterase